MENLLLILHILGAGVVIGTVCIGLFSVAKPPINAVSLDRLKFVYQFGIWGSGWQFVTGLILFLREPEEIGEHTIFWVKIALWFLLGITAGLFVRRQAMRAGKALAEGHTPSHGGFFTLLCINFIIVVLIAAIGVTLVNS